MNKIVLLLVGSGLSHREIVEALDELQAIMPSQVVNQVAYLRSELKGFEGRKPLSSSRSVSYLSSPDFNSHERSGSKLIERQIEQLLRVEAGLTASEASTVLMDALQPHLSASEYVGLPQYNKSAFSEWLHRLLARVPAHLVLHEAARIRNALVHSSGSKDWPLGGG